MANDRERRRRRGVAKRHALDPAIAATANGSDAVVWASEDR